MIFIDKLSDFTAKYPERIFIKSNDYKLTYEELSYSIGTLSKCLNAIGVNDELRVGIILSSSRDLIEVLLSCWKLGAIPVLIPCNSTFYEIKSCINSSDPQLIITNWELSAKIAKIDIPIFPLEELSAGLGGCAIHEKNNNYSTDNVSLVLFTSGSTGIPKAVQLTEKNLLESVLGWHKQIDYNINDLYLNCLPIHHIGGISIFIRSLLYGFTTYMVEKFDTNKIVDIILIEKITLISMVPRMLQKFLDQINRNLPMHLRGIMLSGGLSSKSLMKKCLDNNFPIYKSYGMTETASGICGFWLNRFPDKSESVGIPFHNTDARIVNSELEIKGPTVMKGYINCTSTQEWLATGDYAEIDDDGFIFVKYRQDDMIITGGNNVSAREVEMIIDKHPDIHFAKVYGEKNDDWGQIIVVELKSSISDKEIINWLKMKISKYKIPKIIYRKI